MHTRCRATGAVRRCTHVLSKLRMVSHWVASRANATCWRSSCASTRVTSLHSTSQLHEMAHLLIVLPLLLFLLRRALLCILLERWRVDAPHVLDTHGLGRTKARAIVVGRVGPLYNQQHPARPALHHRFHFAKQPVCRPRFLRPPCSVEVSPSSKGGGGASRRGFLAQGVGEGAGIECGGARDGVAGLPAGGGWSAAALSRTHPQCCARSHTRHEAGPARRICHRFSVPTLGRLISE
jgi:hypothetical protein